MFRDITAQHKAYGFIVGKLTYAVIAPSLHAARAYVRPSRMAVRLGAPLPRYIGVLDSTRPTDRRYDNVIAVIVP